MKPVPVYCLTNTTRMGYKYSVLSLGLIIKRPRLQLFKLKAGLFQLARLEFILILTYTNFILWPLVPGGLVLGLYDGNSDPYYLDRYHAAKKYPLSPKRTLS